MFIIPVLQTNQRVDEMEEGEPMFSNTIALTLHISPIVIISSNTHLHERLGVISGIILAIIFIILIFILVSIFLTRRRKTNKKYSTLTDKSSEELLKPIWVPGTMISSPITVSRSCAGNTSARNKTLNIWGVSTFCPVFISLTGSTYLKCLTHRSTLVIICILLD